MQTIESTASIESHLSRGALYGVIAAAFRRPDNPLFRSMASGEELNAAYEAVEYSENPLDQAQKDAIRNLHKTALTADGEMLMTEFVALFGHTSRGLVPPYETEYGTGGPFFQPQELSDISGFYNAFGLSIDVSKNERLDHISCECEFMCFLCAKQAYALEAGDLDTAAETERVQRLFLRDHLGPFGRTFFARISQQPGITWHAAAAKFGTAFLDSECKRFDITIDRAYMPLRSDEEVNVPMACGGSCDMNCGAPNPDAE